MVAQFLDGFILLTIATACSHCSCDPKIRRNFIPSLNSPGHTWISAPVSSSIDFIWCPFLPTRHPTDMEGIRYGILVNFLAPFPLPIKPKGSVHRFSSSPHRLIICFRSPANSLFSWERTSDALTTLSWPPRTVIPAQNRLRGFWWYLTVRSWPQTCCSVDSNRNELKYPQWFGKFPSRITRSAVHSTPFSVLAQETRTLECIGWAVVFFMTLQLVIKQI